MSKPQTNSKLLMNSNIVTNILLGIIIVWLALLSYKLFKVDDREQTNAKASSEATVSLMNEINKLNNQLNPLPEEDTENQ